jgi:hypothetical protein
MMSADASATLPIGSKKLGDLSKNNAEGNKLRAVKKVAAHNFTGQKQGIRHCSSLFFINTHHCLLHYSSFFIF